jgi:hypothetical protein
VKNILTESGFINISIKPKENSGKIIHQWDIAENLENMVFSAYIKAIKKG